MYIPRSFLYHQKIRFIRWVLNKNFGSTLMTKKCDTQRCDVSCSVGRVGKIISFVITFLVSLCDK